MSFLRGTWRGGSLVYSSNYYCTASINSSSSEPNSPRRTRDLIDMNRYVLLGVVGINTWYQVVVVYGACGCNNISGRRCLVLCIHIKMPFCFCSSGDQAPPVFRRSRTWHKSLPLGDRIKTYRLFKRTGARQTVLILLVAFLADNSGGTCEGGGKERKTRLFPTLSSLLEKVRPVREV